MIGTASDANGLPREREEMEESEVQGEHDSHEGRPRGDERFGIDERRGCEKQYETVEELREREEPFGRPGQGTRTPRS